MPFALAGIPGSPRTAGPRVCSRRHLHHKRHNDHKRTNIYGELGWVLRLSHSIFPKTS